MDLGNETTTDDAPLSMSEAIAAYSQTPDEADAGQSEVAEGEEGEPLETTDNEAEGDETGNEEQTDEEGQPDDEDAEGEEETETEETDEAEEVGGGKFAADDARVRMPDGSFLTIAQLKSGNLMDRDYRQKTMALAEDRKALDTQSEAVTQTKQQLETERDYMARLLQSVMPPQPVKPTVSSAADPFAWVQYQEQQEAYNQFVQHLSYIQQQQDGSKKELTAKQQEDRQGRVDTEFGTLLEKAPDLKDPQKLAAFEADMIATGADYGFSRDEIAAQVPVDHRMALVLRDAMAWRKLQASKTQAQDKVPQPKRPPVVTGGKRQSQGAIQARQGKQAMDRLEKTGSFKDGVAALLALQKG
ncbi:MAG TPA: hypothetical protein VMA55_15715 [Acidovorax sp.]|nr:hypothetical protein [Acidovorax sp.]